MKTLDVEELLRTARERTGLADFGPEDFMEGLGVLVNSINNEAQIRDDSWPHVRERLLRMLLNRLWFARDLKEHPEILDEKLESPVFIGSLPRTGSTKLQRILGASGGLQTPTYWMTLMFARIPGHEDGGTARRIEETRSFEKWMYATSPGILVGHPMFTDEPEEDLWLFESSFRHPIHGGVFHVPAYMEWLARTDWTPAFDYLRAQIKYLRWQFPSGRGKPWLSKTPIHFGGESHLWQAFDKPRFIVTHRDPVKCMPSITATSMSMRQLYSDYDSTASLGSGLTDAFVASANAHMAWRDAHPEAEVLDLSFREITEDGVSAARKVYEFVGIPFTAEAERGVRAWERDNPKDKHGKGVYSSASMGSTDEELREKFAAYRRRFADFI